MYRDGRGPRGPLLPHHRVHGPAPRRFVSAGWNWNLANNDGSHGVHNPPFVFEFLDASIDALNRMANE